MPAYLLYYLIKLMQLLSTKQNYFLCHFLLLLVVTLGFGNCKQSSFLTYQSASQHIYPENGSKLLHTALLLEYPAIAGATDYQVAIAPANCADFEQCSTHLLHSKTLTVNTNKHPLTFGQSYQWRVRAYRNKNILHTSPTYHFEVLNHEKVDTSIFRHRIVQRQKDKFDDGFIFIDDIGVAINLDGQPVYTLPSKGGRHGFECLDLLPSGHIAYLTGDFLLVDLNADTLLHKKGQFTHQQDSCIGFHHSYTTMDNGHFLILGSKQFKRLVPKNTYLRDLKTTTQNDSLITFGYSIIYEIDTSGKVWWTFDWAAYMQQLADSTSTFLTTNGHANSLYYDDEEQAIWLSLRDLNRVIKIDKPSKKVIGSYGYDDEVGLLTKKGKYFRRQHSAELDRKGNLFVYNNDVGKDVDTISSVVLMNLNTTDERLEKLWEFSCDFGDQSQSWSKAKGDVDKIDNQHYLVSMGTIPRTFIVNQQKEVVWEAKHETFKETVYNRINARTEHLAKNPTDGKWQPFVCNYSASWAPSLYPNYFTCQLTQKGKTTFIQINNEGHLANQIHWEVWLDGEKWKNGQEAIAAHQQVLIPMEGNQQSVEVVLRSDYTFYKAKVYHFTIPQTH